LKKPHALIGLVAGLGTALGVLVAVVGLPYGRLNYTAFAGLYHNSGTPSAAFHLAIDCNTSLAGIQNDCTGVNGVLDSVTTHTVEVSIGNNTGAAADVSAIGFEVVNSDITKMSPPAVASGDGKDGNPNFDQVANPGSGPTAWNCSLIPPDEDTGNGGPGTSASALTCFSSDNPGTPLPAFPAGHLPLATVLYNHTPGVQGTTSLSIINGVIGDGGGIELLSCNPSATNPGECFTAAVEFIAAPTNTPTNTATATDTATNTPTATPTPLGAAVNKIPEGNANNVDLLIPAANLWICVTGPCSGPGEGNLIVFEYATNVLTGDQNNDTVADGLGAYEFSVEYDNFVIQSVNPSDVVFAPSGSIAPYPGGADGILDGEGWQRAPANCAFSLVFENVVHFGCVTSGQTPGPTGAMDIARLNLIPHPDLTNDIFPGNDNGVVTVLKDNGCELVDVFGHPVTGSINGGLTPVCGDLAVTVRILEGDLNLDCSVDVQDQQLIAFRYNSFFGSLLYSKWYDLEPNLHDLDIDIKDLQKVFGRDGSTCQVPIGPQPPLGPPAPFGN